MSLEDGILHCEVIKGSFRAGTFALFIQNLLEYMQPDPQSNLVIVMDNCCIHKSAYIQEMIAAWYVRNLAHYCI
jgi:DDE superfamily endonuclease